MKINNNLLLVLVISFSVLIIYLFHTRFPQQEVITTYPQMRQYYPSPQPLPWLPRPHRPRHRLRPRRPRQPPRRPLQPRPRRPRQPPQPRPRRPRRPPRREPQPNRDRERAAEGCRNICNRNRILCIQSGRFDEDLCPRQYHACVANC